MAVALHVVDAFTDRPFAGNPAAVCVLDEPVPEDWMRAVAGEMNLAETAYAVARSDGDWDLRWFTPTTEVSLCGHATLATAHVIGRLCRFHTKGGLLTCQPDAGWIAMDFPADPPRPIAPPAGLDRALGVGEPVDGISRGEILEVASCRGAGSLLVELGSADQVRDLTPDLVAVAALGAEMVIVTAAGDVEASTASRGCSPPPSASPRTRSPARPTASWLPIGRRGSGATTWSANRRRHGAVSCACTSTGIGSCWPARR